MNKQINATNSEDMADLAWVILAIRAAVADTDEVTTALISARLTTLLPHQPFNEIAIHLNKLQQLNVLQLSHQYWQLNSDFLQQLTTSTNCGCGYQAQWALTKSLLEQWQQA